jgi:pyruvyltransferase
MAEVKAYWWNEQAAGVANFGDALNPFLLKRFAGVDANWASISNASIVSTGSLLEHIPPLWDGTILGTGKLFGDSRLSLYTYTANILALRGPLSASGIKGDYAIGDPGLLADELVADDVDGREYDLGLVPHWSDPSLLGRPEFYNNKWRTTVILPSGDPLEVVRKIGRCKKIVTSSLHGMIVADAWGIPRRLEYAPALKNEGAMFKFHDYSQSIGAPLEIGKVIEASRFHVEDRKHELWDAFKAFGRLV